MVSRKRPAKNKEEKTSEDSKETKRPERDNKYEDIFEQPIGIYSDGTTPHIVGSYMRTHAYGGRVIRGLGGLG